MKKAIIVTIYDPIPNYGNRLQNYAVQIVLEKMGCVVETLSFEKSRLSSSQKFKYLIQKMTHYKLGGNQEFWKLEVPRMISFEKFNKKYINTKRIKKIEQIGNADYFVVGSDQVWNPKWYRNSLLKKQIYLLTFVKRKQKICFSPSFSIDRLPDEWEEWFRHYLSDIPYISVREKAGAEIIRKLTGRKAEVTIDPTLMLDEADWNKIACKPENIDCNKNYILTYFLGGRSEQINKDLEKYGKQINADIYNLLDKNQEELYSVDPAGFIYLIAHARLVVTDSFHACVFSFIYNKPFLLYNRIGNEDMLSRMDTLFEIFDLKRKFVESGLENDILENNYKTGRIRLQEERKKVYQFLEKSMKQ